MLRLKKFISLSIAVAVLSTSLLTTTSASAWGRRGWGPGGWGYGGGWGYPGWGYGGGWGYGEYGYGMGGMALGAAAIGAIAASAARQNRYNYGYVQPPVYYSEEYQVPQINGGVTRSKKGRGCYRTEWDALEGYVQVRVPC